MRTFYPYVIVAFCFATSDLSSLRVSLLSLSLSLTHGFNSSTRMPIQKLFARQIFDSRGNPTVEVELTTECGVFTAAVPSGASTGIHEALELRDQDKKHYHGKAVSKAIANVNKTIAPKMVNSVGRGVLASLAFFGSISHSFPPSNRNWM